MKRGLLYSLASTCVFPVFFFGGLGVTAWAVSRGSSVTLVVVAVMVTTMVGLTGMEAALPYYRSWREPRGDIGTDVAHMGITQLLFPRLVEGLIAGALVQASVSLSGWWGGELWPRHWPIALQWGVFLLGSEFVRYWLHRASHEVPLLWRFHAIHHSPTRLYWLNAARFHPLDELLHMLPVTGSLIVLGAPDELVALVFVGSGIHGMMQHSNIDLKLGPLNYVFPMAELHRWHHSLVIEESRSNYGNNLAIWDLVFGTWYNPAGRAPPEQIGPGYMEVPQGYWGQLLAPFVSRRGLSGWVGPRRTSRSIRSP